MLTTHTSLTSLHEQTAIHTSPPASSRSPHTHTLRCVHNVAPVAQPHTWASLPSGMFFPSGRPLIHSSLLKHLSLSLSLSPSSFLLLHLSFTHLSFMWPSLLAFQSRCPVLRRRNEIIRGWALSSGPLMATL